MTVIKVISVGIPGLNGQDAVGAITSINTLEPDESGALTLTAADVGADAEGAAAQALTDANDYTDGIAENKADLIDGLVPANQLPSYVDDVLEYANLAAFPETGSTGKIYVALDTNLTYRWTGSVYAVLDPSLALGETSQTAYRGDRGKTAYDHSQTTGNPHSTAIGDISGLQDALDAKATIANQRYQFVSDAGATYTVPASAVTPNGNTMIELSNNSLTSITVDTNTGTGKTAGDYVYISITGTYGAQALVASGVTLQGDLIFSYQYQTKCLIYKGSNVWKVVG